MPKNRDFKRIVRQRAALTGQRYTEARAELSVTPPPPNADLLARLGVPGDPSGAFRELEALPVEEQCRFAVAGLAHPNWRVRRRCGQLLDDLAVTPETLKALERALEDPNPRVRGAALHSLTCERCKPDGCVLDLQPIYERMINDPDSRVRQAALPWLHFTPWSHRLLAQAATSDTSARVRQGASGWLEFVDRCWAADERRRQLPDELRTKTERHPGKWVAVVDGRIVAAEKTFKYPTMVGKIRRAWPSSDLYWVPPEGAAP